MKGVIWFGKRGKISPRYSWPFEIPRTIGDATYELELPSIFISCSSYFLCFCTSMLHSR